MCVLSDLRLSLKLGVLGLTVAYGNDSANGSMNEFSERKRVKKRK